MVVVMDNTVIVYHAVYFGGNMPMFYPEDKGSIFLRNFGKLANFFRLLGRNNPIRQCHFSLHYTYSPCCIASEYRQWQSM
jgi:hypothetical protein